MNLYIRCKRNYITYLNKDNIDAFIEQYETFKGRKVTIGDYYLFNRSMRLKLLKFCEENTNVDLYTSYDISDPILMSRVTQVFKTPLSVKQDHNIEAYKELSNDYNSVYQKLSELSYRNMLHVLKLSSNMFNLHLNINDTIK